jgi:hypothetical protein
MNNVNCFVIKFIKSHPCFALDELVCAVIEEGFSCWVRPDMSLKEFVDEYVQDGVLRLDTVTGKYIFPGYDGSLSETGFPVI